MKTDSTFLNRLSVLVFVLFFLFPTTDRVKPAYGQPSPDIQSGLTLDVIFRGPMTFMQYQDGEVYALIPRVKGHTYVYARAINNCELKLGTYTPAWPNQANSALDPANLIPRELKIDATQETVSLEQSKVYVTVDLGKPYEVLPIQFDPATVWKQNSAGATEKFYPTGMVVRYAIPNGNQIGSKLTLSPNCELNPESLGAERIVEIGVGPLIEDNCAHKHAHEAFDALKSSLKVDRSIDFPHAPGCPGIRFRAIDCRAPMVVVTNAPNATKPVGSKVGSH